eukprot:Rmarinus@m.4070
MASTLDALLQHAEACVSALEYEAAVKFYQRALENFPDNQKVLIDFGSLLIEIGEVEKGCELLKKSVEMDPESDATKYLYLGQVSNGDFAVTYYKKGIELLGRERDRLMSGHADDEAIAGVNHRISSALCSLGETYLSDFTGEDASDADLETAYARAEEAYTQARTVDAENLEPVQGMAALRLMQSRKEEATQLISNVYQALIDLGRQEDEMQVEVMPPPTFRVETGKLLIEVGMASEATAVLETVVEDDSDNVHVLYLLGLAYKEAKDDGSAMDALNQAMVVMQKNNLFDGETEVEIQNLMKLLEPMEMDDGDDDVKPTDGHPV